MHTLRVYCFIACAYKGLARIFKTHIKLRYLQLKCEHKYYLFIGTGGPASWGQEILFLHLLQRKLRSPGSHITPKDDDYYIAVHKIRMEHHFRGAPYALSLC